VTAAPTVSRPLAQLPNALTIARLVVIPVYAILILTSIRGHSWWAAILFAAAAVTDQVDGFLARRWHVESQFGKIADPLADRLLIDVAVVLLWHAGQLPWIAFAIPARDILVIAATPFAVRKGYQFNVNLLGKIATWMLYASIALVMVVHASWPRWFFWAGFVLAVISLGLYVRKARQEIGAQPGS
jgi:CDP-diacylglycerol--glycerol-3-phosphate 3-phosphatidyltransferase